MIESSPAFRSKLPTLLRAMAIIAIGLVLGCQSNLRVRHQNALDADSKAYSSYEIVQHPVGRSGEVDEIIEQVIHRGMLAKGYARTSASNADILVSYKVLLSGELAPPNGSGGPPDDGLNGEARYSDAQPMWDVVAYDTLPDRSSVNAATRGLRRPRSRVRHPPEHRRVATEQARQAYAEQDLDGDAPGAVDATRALAGVGELRSGRGEPVPGRPGGRWRGDREGADGLGFCRVRLRLHAL